MKKWITVLFLYFSFCATAQVKNDLLALVSKKNMQDIDSYLAKETKDKNLSAHWIYKRALTTGFWEAICEIEHSVPDKQPNVSSVYTYYIKVLYKGAAMAECILTEKKNREQNESWVPYEDTLYHHQDKKTYTELNDEFRKTFFTSLNRADLFVTSVVFGNHCGITGQAPEAKRKIDQLIKTRNTKLLLNWIQSANSEKQLYGLYAYTWLMNNKYQPTKTESAILEFIRNKKGNLKTCSGCIHFTNEIQEAKTGIKHMKPE